MNELTLQKLRQMKLFGMVRAFRTSTENGNMEKLTNDEMVSILVDSEWDDRNNRRIERQMRNARFRYKANVEQLHFDIMEKATLHRPSATMLAHSVTKFFTQIKPICFPG
jgi:hypothetical protein